jgi:hypothetical protein
MALYQGTFIGRPSTVTAIVVYAVVISRPGARTLSDGETLAGQRWWPARSQVM